MLPIMVAKRTQINALEDERRQLSETPRMDPLVLRLRREAQARYDTIWDASKERREFIDAEINRLKEAPARPPAHPTVTDLLRRLHEGVDWSGRWSQYWVSPDARYAIIRKTSGRCWFGIGQPPTYAPSRYTLVDLSKANAGRTELRGVSYSLSLMDWVKIAEVDGRLPRATVLTWRKGH